MRARLEDDLLGAACLVGDICIREHRTEKETCAQPQNRTKNLIRFKLVPNRVRQHKTEYNQLKTKQTSTKQYAISV